MSAINPLVRFTVDLVVFGLQHQMPCVLLMKRTDSPFADCWELPSNEIKINTDAHLEDTAKRCLKQLCGLEVPYLEQVQTLGNQVRDPRGWSVSVVYYSLVTATQQLPQPLQWFRVEEALGLKLAFDHRQIIESCWQRLQNKSLYTSLPIFLLAEEFTLTDLQKVYEVILGFKMEKKSFRRRLLDAHFLEETGNIRRAKHRPAQLYRLAQRQPYYFQRIIEGVRDSKNIE